MGLGANIMGGLQGNLTQEQMQLLALYQNPALFSSSGGMGMGVNPMSFAGPLGALYPVGMGSSAAQFQLPTEKHQVKLFVGGLAFPTTENDLGDYFGELGKVENTIVMRDKITNRGRGFGFVLLSFKDEEAAK